MARIEAIFFLSLLLFSSLPISQSSKKPVPIARKQDIPFIKCQVCHNIATQLYQQINKKELHISPKKVSEFEIIETAENVCNLKKAEGDWITRIDIVENGDKLELAEQDTEGQCNSECKTIERACQEVMGYSDTDVAEYLFKSKPQIESLVNFLCVDLSKACSVKPPPVPKDRIPGEPFLPKPSKEAEMDRIMRSMEGMPGAPNMKMYSKEDLLNVKNFGDEDANDDDDDDDDFPSNLGKVWREKESSKEDWKEKVMKRIINTGAAMRKHANKASHQIKEWWSRKKVGSKTAKASTGEL